MTPSLRRSILAGPIAALAVAGLLGGCQKASTTTQASDGATTTTTTTTTVAPTDAASNAGTTVRDAAREAGTEASQAMSKAGAEAGQAMNKAGAEAGKAMSKAGEMVEDGVITAKIKTALLADPDVKGLLIDVDTKDGVVTLKGTADKAVNSDRAVRIAKDTGGVKSVNNQLVVKTAG